MSTEFIDVSGIKENSPGSYISRIAAANNPVLVFMANLDYSGMYDAEELASQFNIGFLNIPITLPMMDLVRQIEFAGIRMTPDLLSGIESAFRSSIIRQFNEEGARIEFERTDRAEDSE